jgi:ABC-type transport system substrate-binding protein
MRAESRVTYGLLACSLVLYACNSPLEAPTPVSGSPTPSRGGTVHFATTGDIRTLDPVALGDGIAPSLVELMYAGLVDYDDTGQLAGDLAERWTHDESGMHYAFTLRQGVRFHDGNELTAADVVRSFRRALAPKTPNSAKSFYFGIVGAEAFATGKDTELAGIVADGKYLVRMNLKEPDATFLPVMALHSIRPVCPSGGDSFDPEFVPCGAGPFKLAAWARGLEVSLARHEGYFRSGLPYLDAVNLSLSVPKQAQRVRFAHGALDLIRDLGQADTQRFASDARWKPYVFFDPEVQMGGEAMNVEMAPFNNVEFRRAIAAAIDRSEIEKAKPTMLRALTQPVPQGVRGHNPALACQSFDRARALSHMQRAGYGYDPATGKGGYPSAIPYYGYPGSAVEYTSQILAQQLARIGVRLELRLVTYATWQTLTRRRGQAAFGAQGWRMDFSDPSNFTESIFHTNAITDEDSSNPSFYSNPDLDRAMDAAHRELNAKKRATMYDEIQQRICDDAPWAFTFSVRFANVRNPRLRGYPEQSPHIFNVTSSWLDQEPRRSFGMLLHPARTLSR